jgi:hypothetical protein
LLPLWNWTFLSVFDLPVLLEAIGTIPPPGAMRGRAKNPERKVKEEVSVTLLLLSE